MSRPHPVDPRSPRPHRRPKIAQPVRPPQPKKNGCSMVVVVPAVAVGLLAAAVRAVVRS